MNIFSIRRWREGEREERVEPQMLLILVFIMFILQNDHVCANRTFATALVFKMPFPLPRETLAPSAKKMIRESIDLSGYREECRRDSSTWCLMASCLLCMIRHYNTVFTIAEPFDEIAD